MKAAFVVWQDRIAPVFDVAHKARIVEMGPDPLVADLDFPDGPQEARAAFLAQQGVELVVCGAISRPVEALLAAFGIQVAAFVSGAVNDVIEAWAKGELVQPSFAMPGCRRHGRGRGWAGSWQEVGAMMGNRGFGAGAGWNGGFGEGRGMGRGGGMGAGFAGGRGGGGGAGRGAGRGAGGGAGRGAGRGGAGPGRRGAVQGGLGMGPDGACVCPQCGYQFPHRPGVPCMEETCPKCGATMARE